MPVSIRVRISHSPAEGEHPAQLLRVGSSMSQGIRSYACAAARALGIQSQQNGEKRPAYVFALLLVSAVAGLKYVTGMTGEGAPFTLYGLAIAVTAVRGGFAPALVATLASVAVGSLVAPPPLASRAWLLFAVEGVSLALVVMALRSRLRATDERRAWAEATIARLTDEDLARRREWGEYRQAAAQAQAALERAAGDTRQQLAALESLTDPSLNPLAGDASVTELLERLRAAVRADGAALVQRRRAGAGVVAAHGLQPAAGLAGVEGPRLTPGRVAVVHNDPARVCQQSALRWPAEVSSLLAVPVMHDGQARSAIEVVNERSREVSDWDVALVRVAAERLAAVVVQDGSLAAKAS